jgi:RNA polymerase sigma-70 factor (ECF subfamily)
VFLLREVFDYEYAEIAQITGRGEAACRQLFSRAKKHIREQRPRFPASPEAHREIVGRFMEAFTAGDIDSITQLLAEDVTVWADGGGKVAGSARHPIQGRDKVTRAVIALMSHAPGDTTVEMIEANGLPALLLRIKEQIVAVLTLDVADGLIQAVRSVSNPDKLAHLNPPASEKARKLKS